VLPYLNGPSFKALDFRLHPLPSAEQVTDFKYLGYRISKYKRDLEDKLQTYNKINGAIRRHFGKQMNKETKLRIHNITAKAAL